LTCFFPFLYFLKK